MRAESAILMNAETGAILYEKNGDEVRYPASITKIATALYALEKNRGFLDSDVIAEQDSIGTVKESETKRTGYKGPPYRLTIGGTHIGIKRGEVLPLRALLYGMMLESGNDAANVIAQYTSGKITTFVQEMNAHLKAIGCQKTTFKNPSGLHHPDHQTTAYDMAVMTREALRDPVFREIVKTVHYTRPKTNKQDEATLYQHNRLVKRGACYYKHAIGVKTGYHSLAGNNVVAAAEKDGRTLIAVLMGYKDKQEKYEDAIALFEEAYSQPLIQRTLFSAGKQKMTVPVEGAGSVSVYIEEPVVLEYYEAETPKVRAWVEPIERTVPVHRGEKMGQMLFADAAGNVLKTVDLYASEDVKGSLTHRMKAFFSEYYRFLRYGVLFTIVIGCILIGFYLLRS